MGNEQTLHQVRRAVWRLAGWQLGLTVGLAAAAGLFVGRIWAMSALVGGSIGIVAGLYQALRMLKVDASIDPERFLSGVYAGEALKIVLTVALFIAAIRLLPVELIPVMVTYAATYTVYWLALRTGFPWVEGRAQPGGQEGTRRS